MKVIGLVALASAAVPAYAGPPYLTDDPEPTDTGHWEIYAFTTGEGRKSTADADAGFDLNYGAVRGVQLTATLPLSFSHAPVEGWRGGTGDVELGVKYRFFHDAAQSLSAAIFPRAIQPTAAQNSLADRAPDNLCGADLRCCRLYVVEERCCHLRKSDA